MSSWCYFCLKQLCSDWKRCLTNGLGDSPDADNETFNCSNWRLLPWKIRYIHLHLSESLVGVISRQGNQERIKGLSQEAFVQTLAGFSRRSCHVYGDRMGKKEWGHIFPFFFFFLLSLGCEGRAVHHLKGKSHSTQDVKTSEIEGWFHMTKITQGHEHLTRSPANAWPHLPGSGKPCPI